MPYFSVIVPVLNEAAHIGPFIDGMRRELSSLVPSWEILVVDNGSTDRTREIVEAEARTDRRIRLIDGERDGKGAAVRQGLLAASGEWRFMADADLAMPPDNLDRFLALVRRAPVPDIVIGSREAPGARRVGEPWTRHVVGRVFNLLVRAVALPGMADTQCGFKLFSAPAVERVFPRVTSDGFAFDVEVLLLARSAGLDIREVGILWKSDGDSRVSLLRGAAAFLDVLRIRWRWRHADARPRRLANPIEPRRVLDES